MQKNWFKTLMLMLLELMNVNSFSQKSKDSVAYISKYPVKEGYIYYYKDELPSYNDPAPYVFIFSKDDDVGALMAGRVKRIFNIRGMIIL